ncbi:hypothetical protein ACGFYZ_20340 [Streptomyces sp. NPDC048330]|uniref:hypothetical protein n=1 Tax=Streptomyces sp. NPDC048330 TaxID=3365533 RepID=UPI00371AEC7B
MTRSRLSLVNRVALGLLGLALLALGGTRLAAAPWIRDVVPWWPTRATSGTVLLDADALLAGVRQREGAPYGLAAAAVCVALVCVVWCAAQAHGRARSWTALPASGAVLRSGALGEAVDHGVLAIDSVAACRTRVAARTRRLDLVINVSLRPDGTPEAVLPLIAALTAQVERAVAPHGVRVEVRLRRGSFATSRRSATLRG